MEELVEKLQTVHLESETAERIAEEYMTYLWAGRIFDFVFLSVFMTLTTLGFLTVTGFFRRKRK